MLYDLLSLLFSAFLGGLISLSLYKLSERKEKDKQRIEEFHELILKTKEIAFESTDLITEIKKIDIDSIARARHFTGQTIPDYTLSALSNAIYIDEKIYNKTIDFIDTLRKQLDLLGEYKMESEEFIARISLILNIVSKEGFDTMNFFETEYQEYLIEFGNKYIGK